MTRSAQTLACLHPSAPEPTGSGRLLGRETAGPCEHALAVRTARRTATAVGGAA
ncbi:hypothetical protein ABZ318_05305 [Streptomyces sp. NPDC006197]|uniref:hypothetical protein n=1 Tax=Streptomyces sp. NPDC006197 TaxID=3156685 RepID=UPI0033BD8A84